MNYRLKNLLALVLMTILCTSCELREVTLADQIYQADTLEIPIPSYENPTILTDKNDIRLFLDIIKESEWENSVCFCVGNMNIYFKQGTNILATITVKHDGENLSWHDGITVKHNGESRSSTAYATLTKSSLEKMLRYFERLEKEAGVTVGNWKRTHWIKRPRMELEPLSPERLNQINECEMKRANQPSEVVQQSERAPGPSQ